MTVDRGTDQQKRNINLSYWGKFGFQMGMNQRWHFLWGYRSTASRPSSRHLWKTSICSSFFIWNKGETSMINFTQYPHLVSMLRCSLDTKLGFNNTIHILHRSQDCFTHLQCFRYNSFKVIINFSTLTLYGSINSFWD